MSPEQATAGTRVRVTGAPERTGTIAGELREREGVWRAQVRFDNGERSVMRLDNLEPLPAERDLFEDVARAQLEGPASLRRNLLHEKLNGRLSEVMYSMDTSDTTFLAYQFKPVIKLLESPTNSLLVADEVGLGKTIEAGLIWTELRAREGARSLLVVCPPHLMSKWCRELKNRFGVDAQKSTAAEVEEKLGDARRGATSGFALVASYHGLRPPKGWDEGTAGGPAASLALKLQQWGSEAEPFLDLLVMDEAAIMRNQESKISELGELLAPVCHHKVYLSATPLHTEARNLFTLLKRLDPDTFPDEETFKTILGANEPLVRLRKMILDGKVDAGRLLTQLDLAANSPLLQDSQILADLRTRLQAAGPLDSHAIRAQLAYQSERCNLLSYVVTRTRKRDVDLRPILREVNTVKVPLSSRERTFYDRVTDAVLDYAEERGIRAGFLTVMPQRQVASCMAAACERLDAGAEEDDPLNPDRASGAANNSGQDGRPLIAYLKGRLAGQFDPADFRRNDSKWRYFIGALQKYWDLHPGGKVVLFAFFKPTIYYLRERLESEGIGTLTLTGDDTRDKQEIVDDFARSKRALILLCSEVGGEGLDLQFASAMVNYDLPWNPMVVEQRIGRIHRIGQEAERIVVINMICEETVDERIYDRLYLRLDLFHRTLGDLEAVIGPVINELTKELLTHRLPPAQLQEKIESAAQALENNMLLEENLEQEASVLAAYGDYVINQIAAAHERQDWINGADLETYLLEFFRLRFPATRLQGLDPRRKLFQIELDSDAIYEFERFLGQRQLAGQTRLKTREPRKIRFDHRVFTPSEGGVETIHQAHPLVRFACDHLRANRIVQPVPVAIALPPMHRPKDAIPGLYAFVTQRWTVDGLRPHERLHHEVVRLPERERVEEPHVAAAIVEVAAALGERPVVLPPQGDELYPFLALALGDLDFDADERFHDFESRCRLENEDRKRIQLRGIDGFEQRREQQILRIRAIHEAANRPHLVAAMDGQLEKLRLRSEDQRTKVARRSVTIGEARTIAAGFIQIG